MKTMLLYHGVHQASFAPVVTASCLVTGENIYPREIAEYLFQHPKIQQVAVFGVPDEKHGEAVAAWISLQDGENADEAPIAFKVSGSTPSEIDG